MRTPRYASAAGTYRSEAGDVLVVVAGGLGAVGTDNTNTVRSAEIFSMRCA